MKVRISLAAVAVLLAACGGSSSNDDATPAVVVETARDGCGPPKIHANFAP